MPDSRARCEGRMPLLWMNVLSLVSFQRLTIYWVVWAQDSVRSLSWQDGSATESEGSEAARRAREGTTRGARHHAGGACLRCRDSRQPSVVARTRRGESVLPRAALDRQHPPR